MTPDILDTPPAIAGEQRRLLMARTPLERMKMMAAMWADGVRLVESSLRAAGVSDPVELRIRTFRRIYASDFDAETMDRIVERLVQYIHQTDG